MPSRFSRLTLLIGVAILVLAGCSSDKPLDTLSPDGEKAQLIDDLIKPVFVIAFIIFFLVFGAVMLAWWKFRVRAPGEGDDTETPYPDDEFPSQVHGNTQLEIGWTIVPAVLLVVISVFTLAVLFQLDDVEAEENPVEIVVVGHQWWWEYQYHLDGDASDGPPDFVTANEAVIPVETDVQIKITSRDVIHSYWIPRLNGKRDAAPGRVHTWVIQADKPGLFWGTCTEFCGLSHAYMRMTVVALADADYNAWVDGQLEEQAPPAEGEPGFEGWELFEGQCARCHMVVGSTERDLDGDADTPPQPDNYEVYGSERDYITPGGNQGMYTGEENLLAGAAPNLTHFAGRATYAGSYFELYSNAEELIEDDPSAYLRLAEEGQLDRAQLEAWLRNAPAEKPNRWENAQGMPPLELPEDDIDALVDYLLTLD